MLGGADKVLVVGAESAVCGAGVGGFAITESLHYSLTICRGPTPLHRFCFCFPKIKTHNFRGLIILQAGSLDIFFFLFESV